MSRITPAAAGPSTLRFYRRVLRELSAAGIRFLLGGG